MHLAYPLTPQKNYTTFITKTLRRMLQYSQNSNSSCVFMHQIYHMAPCFIFFCLDLQIVEPIDFILDISSIN